MALAGPNKIIASPLWETTSGRANSLLRGDLPIFAPGSATRWNPSPDPAGLLLIRSPGDGELGLTTRSRIIGLTCGEAMTEVPGVHFLDIFQKKPRRDGGHEPGLPVPYGGTCDGEGNPITEYAMT